jgi:subtilisin family serine protease
MNQLYYKLFIVCTILLCLLFIPAHPTQAQTGPGIEQKVLRVKFKENFVKRLEKAPKKKGPEGHVETGLPALDQLNKKWKVTSIKRLFRDGGTFEAKHRKYGLHLWYELEIEEGGKTLPAVASFAKFAEVLTAEPAYKKHHNLLPADRGSRSVHTAMPTPPNDPQLSEQWHFNNTGQGGGVVGADIRLLEAWQQESGHSSVIVAVIDSGIDGNHPDLAANVWINTREIPGNGIDDDNNGYIDDVYGYNFGDDTGRIPADYHGTHVGGTIAATSNNGIGVAGIAGGSGTGDGARLMSLAAFGQWGVGGFGQAFIYAADMGAVIAQNSWGYVDSGVYEQAVLDAIDYFIAEAGYDEQGRARGPMQGGIVIFAAGNSGTDEQWYPAYYEPVMAVAATDRYDQLAYFSNRGNWVELAAPGVEVLSTLPGNAYGYLDGTSMACPHVSGVAALIVSKFAGNITPQQLWIRLLSSTDQPASLPAGSGSGRLNAARALRGSPDNDNQPPYAVTDLVAEEAQGTTITVGWTAPADPGDGNASYYDLRYSTEPITAANFQQAHTVPGLIVAAAAGTAQTFTVSRLQPRTTYYIALKAIDLFGNASGLSNIAQGTTLDAPILSISPASLSLEIDVSQSPTLVSTLAVSNLSQESRLEFSAHSTGFFLEISPTSASLAPGESTDIQLTFNVSALPNGQWDFEMIIRSNDPNNASLSVPITLLVSGQIPRLEIEQEVLDFGATGVGDYSQQWLYIRNIGGDVLHLYDIGSDHPAFESYEQEVYIYPLEEYWILVKFQPTELGTAEGRLQLSSNDPQQPQLSIALTGEGIAAPIISISPSSFDLEIDVRANPITEARLTITNEGLETLEFWTDQNSGEEYHMPVRFNPASGSLLPAEQLEVEVLVDGSQLANGWNYAIGTIISNDPSNPYSYINLYVMVQGHLPILSPETSEVVFETIFAGSSQDLPVVIRNLGGEYLHLYDIASDHPAFKVYDQEAYVPPFGDTWIWINFSPTETGAYQGSLHLRSNDPEYPQLEIRLIGQAIPAPKLSLTPSQINASLLPGESGSELLTLSNTGGSPLNFSFPALAAQQLLQDPKVKKNNTSTIGLPAQVRNRAKDSKEARPVGHPVVLGAGADLEFGYTWIDSDSPGGPAFEWEDIAESGTEILQGQDDAYEEIPLPFSLNFYGEVKNKVRISTNGYLTFGETGYEYWNQPIPQEWEPNDIIAPFWTDLVTYNDGAHIYYRASPEALIVQYENVGSYGSPGSASFQVKVMADGIIYFYYKQMSTSESANSATIGLENAAGTDGLQIVYNNAYVKDLLAVMIMPPGPRFITGVSIPFGTIAPNSSQQVTVHLAAGELAPGEYKNNLVLLSNDPTQSRTRIPVFLEINHTAGGDVEIPTQYLAVGGVLNLNLSKYFKRPDKDKLRYTATASAPDLLGVKISGQTLHLKGLHVGTSSVAVVATNDAGESISSTFTVEISEGKKGSTDSRITFVEGALPRPLVYPNPFAGETRIYYSLTQKSDVRLQVYTLQGRRVSLLAEEEQQAGNHSLRIDASGLPSGMYIYYLQLDKQLHTGRIIIK